MNKPVFIKLIFFRSLSVLAFMVVSAQFLHSQGAQPANENRPNNAANLNGFDGNTWGNTYKTIKDRFLNLAATGAADDRVDIVADFPGRELVISRKGILYRYVFYLKPESIRPPEKPATDTTGPNDAKPETEDVRNSARFFFVESIFPLVNSEDLYARLIEKYGKRTASTVKEEEFRGAYVWEKSDGYMVQWVEPYKDKSYTRSIFYLSKAIKTEIEKDLQEFQFQKEIAALKNLLP